MAHVDEDTARTSVAIIEHDHEKAYAVLNQLLTSLRSDRVDSVSVCPKSCSSYTEP